ncbi:hypothetical protein Patl1_24409 [Pistacia atlantica]|uniref:Uncharacterized protein n=1 Tax=Pistacia atlantica TaxID=434234 RepID=A0ACC0ZU80_9ROSI|nr:hypothetical protein Patl1_24409 [Pistacia atlantica]
MQQNTTNVGCCWQVKIKLKGHQNRITGLAFSQTLNALVSSGADAQWSPKDTLPAPISSAIYSCDGLLVYAGFVTVSGPFIRRILNIQLFCINQFRCFKAFFVYSLYQNVEAHQINHSLTMYILQQHYHIAAHPSEPNQIGLGMSDGAVHVVEPSDAELKWVAHSPKTKALSLLICHILP